MVFSIYVTAYMVNVYFSISKHIRIKTGDWRATITRINYQIVHGKTITWNYQIMFWQEQPYATTGNFVKLVFQHVQCTSIFKVQISLSKKKQIHKFETLKLLKTTPPRTNISISNMVFFKAVDLIWENQKEVHWDTYKYKFKSIISDQVFHIL
jgi:hypothetical protein